MLEKSKSFKKSENVTWKKIGDDRVILLDLNSGKYFSLNETAAVIWKSIISDKTLGDIVDEISKRFESNSTATDDVQDIVDNLVTNGLISEKAGSSICKTDGKEILEADFSIRPYIKPGVQEHAPIKHVTAGSYTTYGGYSHYWYPC